MRSRKGVTVELTSLLDVIFIMLFMLLVGYQKNALQARQDLSDTVSQLEDMKEENDGKIAEMEQYMSDMESELSACRIRIAAYEKFEETANFVTITLENKNDTDRQIIVSDKGGDTFINFNWDNAFSAKNTLNSKLNSYLTGDSLIFMTFVYDEGNVFNQDFNMVKEIVDAYISRNENIYYTEGN